MSARMVLAQSEQTGAGDPARGLIACPICDMLHTAATPSPGGRLRCRRCRAVLMTNLQGAEDRILAASIGGAILLVAAVSFPFLEISAAGFSRSASVIDAAFAFSGPLMLPLSIATAFAIIFVPILRAFLLAYTLLPLRLGRAPAPHGKAAFRLASKLKPWSMAEIFLIGVTVALVKVAGMASVHFGVAFWAMVALVLIVVLEKANLSEWTIWQKLDQTRRS